MGRYTSMPMDLLPYEPYEPYTAAVQDALEGCFTGKCHACIFLCCTCWQLMVTSKGRECLGSWYADMSALSHPAPSNLHIMGLCYTARCAVTENSEGRVLSVEASTSQQHLGNIVASCIMRRS